MIVSVGDATSEALAEADEIIDVRSPSEFACDHVPGAVNLPVLSDAERVEVGTAYVQADPFRARRLGAALVSRNIARHLEDALAGRGPAWRPLIYCWRGGQRSGAMATVLSEIGWRTSVLRGGYKTFRRSVVRALYDEAPLANIVLLAGPTGVGKTEVLARLAQGGVQVLDLEALAGHRGSLLGALPGRDQPSQRMFESRLAAAMATLDPQRPVVVEAESSRIGDIALPPVLWAGMQTAPFVELQASREDRVQRLVRQYGGTPDQHLTIASALGRLPRHISRRDVDRWSALLATGELAQLAGELIEGHYDPAYARSLHRVSGPRLGGVGLEPGESVDRAAKRLEMLLGQALRSS